MHGSSMKYAKIIFANGALTLHQKDMLMFATIAHSMHKMHALENCEKDSQDECEIHIPCEICANIG